MKENDVVTFVNRDRMDNDHDREEGGFTVLDRLALSRGVREALEPVMKLQSKEEKLQAGLGGLIRITSGDWIMGFTNCTYAASPLQAEFLALKQDLQIALQMQLQPLEIKTDSTEMIKLIKESDEVLNDLIYDCRWLMLQLKLLAIRHTFRQGNATAHMLAKEASHQS
uniref:Uncharacterized protein LOC104240341 n=1 Tax=Nicotiana sylvestris TaxID=4096 RepID=A0A1U7XN60_NICSY|nr:PREDICTED: uncharacterized protein LOC104240341 [Nicotiana sylvestris]